MSEYILLKASQNQKGTFAQGLESRCPLLIPHVCPIFPLNKLRPRKGK